MLIVSAYQVRYRIKYVHQMWLARVREIMFSIQIMCQVTGWLSDTMSVHVNLFSNIVKFCYKMESNQLETYSVKKEHCRIYGFMHKYIYI